MGAALIAGVYIRLSTERHLGFGCVGPIPVSKIWEWADRRGLHIDAAQFMEDLILHIDQETMRRQAKPSNGNGK